MSDIKVSVLCMVYNHEPYLRQCLDGFVMQKTNFEYEVLIHDDASTDNSQEIIREYEKKYPDIIKPIYQTENQGSQKISPTQVHLLPRAKGKYIAFCEGDDYWCDENKLQMQFDYMEDHPNASLCANKVRLFDSHTEETLSHIPLHRLEDSIKMPYYLNQVLVYGSTFHWCSMFFKTQDYKEYAENRPDFSKNLNFGDIPIFLYLLTKGEGHCIDKVMSCYRRNYVGSWTSSHLGKRTKHHLIALYNLYTKFDAYTEYRYKKEVSALHKRYAKDLYYHLKLYGKTDIELPDDYLKYVTFTDKVKLSLHALASRTKRRIKKLLRR